MCSGDFLLGEKVPQEGDLQVWVGRVQQLEGWCWRGLRRDAKLLEVTF